MSSRLLLIMLALAGLFGCTAQSSNLSRTVTTPIASPVPTASPTPRSDTIQEGETRQITLKQYESNQFTASVSVQYFVTDQATSGEGTTTWFYAKQSNRSPNKDAYVQIFFPNHAPSASQLRELVIGNRGLFLVNGWKATGKETTKLYPWATEKITFEKRSQNQLITGAVFLGQSNGRAFYAIEHYPGDSGDGFAPLASKILGSLEVQPRSAKLSNRSKLALDGIGNVRVGMTVTEASSTARVPLIVKGSPPPRNQCNYVELQQGTEGLNFMLDSERISKLLYGELRAT